MKVEIVSKSNPYVLDVLKDDETVVALTRKNADFIEAVVGLDSNYRNDSNVNSANATAYWFNKMILDPSTYYGSLKKCIEIIDSVNSTHLESTINGRERMFGIINNFCRTPDELKRAVCVNPSQNDYDNLFYRLCETMDNHKGYKANNIFFASKFISYARKYLNKDSSFSKYDSIVSKRLTKYEHFYVDKNIRINAYKYTNNYNERRSLTDLEKQRYTYATYISYMNAINRILEHLKNDNGIIINKEEFDHIVWYSSKGNQ